jgi:hypothetical protein
MNRKFLLLSTAILFGLSTPLQANAGQAIIAVQPTNTPPVNVPSDSNAQPYFNTGTGVTFVVTPTISTLQYSPGNCLGTIQSMNASRFASSGVTTAPKGFWLTNIQIFDKSTQNIPIDLIVFDNTPAAYTDNAACVLATIDATKIAAVLHVTDWTTAGLGSASYNANFHIVSAAPVGNFNVLAVARGTATYAALALTFKYNIVQD